MEFPKALEQILNYPLVMYKKSKQKKISYIIKHDLYTLLYVLLKANEIKVN